MADDHTGAGTSGLKVCVIIPTYNNSRTLKRVIGQVLDQTGDVIVVNDGSTDDTAEILSTFPQIIRVDFPLNSGKGLALRAGFKKALELGFDYAITIDSDGQHFASDIPLFIEELQKSPRAILIGSRNMSQEGVPRKSSFGNKFSNFWFWFETGIRLQDTQSGYRLYPLRLLPKKFYTSKFEFEIEVIVRSAWRGVEVKNIPISVLYDPDERVSHFRPLKDFTRISILNTVLVVITLLYIKLRDLILKLRSKGLKRFLVEDVLRSTDSREVKSLSVALGVFVGIAPIWGIQTLTVLFLAALFRLNKVIAFAFSNVSFPPFIPLIIYASLIIGSWFTGSGEITFESAFAAEDISRNIWQYLIGSVILATAAAALAGLTTYLILTVFTTFKPKK